VDNSNSTLNPSGGAEERRCATQPALHEDLMEAVLSPWHFLAVPKLVRISEAFRVFGAASGRLSTGMRGRGAPLLMMRHDMVTCCPLSVGAKRCSVQPLGVR